MAKYGRKLEIIEAFKFVGGKEENKYPTWIEDAIKEGDIYEIGDSINGVKALKIISPEGIITADRGDYIIQGEKGRICPCKSDIFEKIYEAVGERKDCGSENNEKINVITIKCDGEEIILNTKLTLEDVAKHICELVEEKYILTSIEDYFHEYSIYFNPKKVSSIKYFKKWN